MDLLNNLLESKKRGQNERRSWRATTASIVLHAVLLGGIIYAGTIKPEHKVDAEEPMKAFLTQGAAPPPPPPPPPPPAQSSGAPKQSTPKAVEIPRPMTSSVFTPPVEIPKEIPKVLPMTARNLPVVETPPVVEEEPAGGTLEGPGDALAGVVGGVQGGVAGGIVGGEVGGVVGGEVGGVIGGEIGGKVGGTGTGTEGEGTGGVEAPVAPPPPPPPPAEPEGPLRVGGNVKAPVATDRVKPNYTDAARKARVSGVVVVEAIIDKNGNVDNVRVIKGLPAGLAEEAVRAVKKWHFKPGTLNGKPVDTIFNLTVTFALEAS